MMQTADSISHFALWGKPEEMKEMCRTQWVERHDAFMIFPDLFLPTFCCLEAITIEHRDKLRYPDTDAGYVPVFHSLWH